ncbi:MAG: protoporphyrinogen oxidase [Lentisphaeria bacterium]|nr:protoporphyrinogen oxidase [Lentisphaeria bacterium]MDP7740199.1 protoporphyrinogen oxidase [Lentisphaeria bacterium]
MRHNTADNNSPGVAIIGGGISGLAAAWYLKQRGISCVVLEAANRCGGKIVSERRDGFLIEGGPDSVLTEKPWAIDLCRELGLADQLLPMRHERAGFFILRDGQLASMPEGMLLMIPSQLPAFLRNRLISPAGKIRMLAERFVRPRPNDTDESVASFVTRRFGRECLDSLAGPLLGGIYMARPENLSMRCAFPRFLDAERKHGSLIKAVQKRAGAARGSMFTTLKDGMGCLVEALAARLDEMIHVDTDVTEIGRHDASWIVRAGEREWHAKAVVLACPVQSAAALCADLAPAFFSELQTIRHVSTATVSLAYSNGTIHPSQIPDGTGFIVPEQEGRRILACTWVSNKFAGRAPEHGVLIRVFIGGDAHGDLVTSCTDEALVQIARDELRDIMKLDTAPSFASVYRWKAAHPQYEVGHLDRVERIEAAAQQLGRLYVTGWPYRGNGISDCVRCAHETADRIADELNH